MREPLRDPDPSSGRGGEVMWRCPPGQQLLERCGAFPSLSYTRGRRRGGRPWVKGKRLPFSPKSQSGECPCCRKPGKSLAEQPCFFKARYSSVPSRGVTQREPGRSVGDERAPAGSRPLPRERGEATWRCPPGQQRLAALKRGSQSQPRKRQRQLCQAGWVSKLYKRGCGSGMISVKSTTSKRASRLPGGSLQCPRQRAHLQTGASCLLRTDDPPQSHSPAASFTLVKTASVCFLLALIAVFTGSCGKPGARINTAA
ncbi:uncharacterized protein [Phaenicophaeus curvirostris]|uniref:uncharacterized protein isoform X2 n=1 Tax=Phaenicophaeus curvirostris TaxID=33595 RepID=UPI0037F0D35F